MKKLFIGNLPPDTDEAALRALLEPYGTVRGIDLASDIFTGMCKGFGFVQMEGHEARAVLEALDGKTMPNTQNTLKVRYENPRGGRKRGRR